MMKSVMGESPFRGNELFKMMIFEIFNLSFTDFFSSCSITLISIFNFSAIMSIGPGGSPIPELRRPQLSEWPDESPRETEDAIMLFGALGAGRAVASLPSNRLRPLTST